MVADSKRRQSLNCLRPVSPFELVPQPSSAFDDILCLENIDPRPSSSVCSSGSSSPRHTMAANLPPTLNDILLDNSPAPWTLTAFMAFLSQNHCMETLEFTLDLQRYAQFYEEFKSPENAGPESDARILALWDRLIQVYIIPCAPREINIPSRVRDRLLGTSRSQPPHPSELNEAGRIIYELMNDSLLVPFLESVSPAAIESVDDRRTSKSPRSSVAAVQRSSRGSARNVIALQPEMVGLSDESEANSPATAEPMTPPTTPPTSDWGFSSSPTGLQRAFAAHSKGWKRVGARLGFGKRGGAGRGPSSDASQSRRSSGGSAC